MPPAHSTAHSGPARKEEDSAGLVPKVVRALGTSVATWRNGSLRKGERRSVEGWVEGLRGLRLEGWVIDPAAPAEKLEVELLLDRHSLTRDVADRFRQDLADAGKADGHCGFSLAVPFDALRGRRGTLSVRETRTGQLLRTVGDAALEIDHMLAVEGCLEGIDGGFAAGWVRAPVVGEAALSVALWIDGELVETGEASVARNSGMGFRLRIPDAYHDGRPHEFAVTLAGREGQAIDRLVAISPLIMTPFDALQLHAGTAHLKGYLSAVGPWRYESMRQALLQLTRTAAEDADGGRLAARLNALVHGHEQAVRGFRNPSRSFPLISFEIPAAPMVTVVIPVHNQFEVSYHCLASIAAAPNRASFEIVVVDDGSTDETLRLPEIVHGVTLVRHAHAAGFVDACNAGAARARGQYIVLLNNDTEVATGWLDELLDPFTRFAGVGLVGAKLVYPDGRLQEAGGLVWGDGSAWNVGRGGNPGDPRYNYTRQVDYVSGACVMLPTSLWRSLGGLDRHFAPAYFEDTDLAFRVRAAGCKTVYTPFCEVIHHEGLSNGVDTAGSGLKRFQAINEPKFRARWASVYRGHGTLGRDTPNLMQDRFVDQRALMLDSQTLTPDQDAGSYSGLQEIRLLQSLGFKVTFVPSNMAYLGGYTDALQRMGVEVVYAPFAFSMAEVLDRRGDEFDLVWIARHSVADQVIERVRARCPRAKVVLNIHDLHFLRELREALAGTDPSLMQHALATRDTELAVMRKVDLAVSYSEVEQAVVLSHNLASTRMATCPWVVDASGEVPGFEQRHGIAFLGGFGHRPNAGAVEWFVREVMPHLREKLPGVVLRVYGSKVTPQISALAAPDVLIEGYVRDVNTVYDRARVFVAPLLTGAGLKGKVIGAFARGVPTVMTPTAAEGTGARHGLEARIATRPDEWVNAIVALHTDAAAWQHMSGAARDLARERYSFEHGRETMMSALQAAGVFTSASHRALCPLVLEPGPL